MRPVATRICVSVLIALARPAPAEAGAWLMPKGAGQIIETLSVSSASSTGSGAGRQPWRQLDLTSLMEWGASDRLTLSMTSAFQRIGGPAPGPQAGLAPAQFGARTALWTRPGAILSAQASLIASSLPAGLSELARSGRDPGLELRLLYGQSETIFGAPAFFDGEAAWRSTGYGGVGEFRGEASLGVSASARVTLLFQSFATASVRPAALASADQPAIEEKLQLSLVRRMGDSWSLQIGCFATAYARGVGRERGSLLALWRDF